MIEKGSYLICPECGERLYQIQVNKVEGEVIRADEVEAVLGQEEAEARGEVKCNFCGCEVMDIHDPDNWGDKDE